MLIFLEYFENFVGNRKMLPNNPLIWHSQWCTGRSKQKHREKRRGVKRRPTSIFLLWGMKTKGEGGNICDQPRRE